MRKAAGLGGGCGGLPAVRGGFHTDAAGLSSPRRGGVRLYGGLCRAARRPGQVKAETEASENVVVVVESWMEERVCAPGVQLIPYEAAGWLSLYVEYLYLYIIAAHLMEIQ